MRFLDDWGQPIAPPDLRPRDDDPGGGTYTPPLGERLVADTFTWN